MVSFSLVSRRWFSIDSNCDRRCSRCRASDLNSEKKIGVKFQMYLAGTWRWLALIISSVSFSAAASIDRKLVISKSCSESEERATEGDVW